MNEDFLFNFRGVGNAPRPRPKHTSEIGMEAMIESLDFREDNINKYLNIYISI